MQNHQTESATKQEGVLLLVRRYVHPCNLTNALGRPTEVLSLIVWSKVFGQRKVWGSLPSKELGHLAMKWQAQETTFSHGVIQLPCQLGWRVCERYERWSFPRYRRLASFESALIWIDISEDTWDPVTYLPRSQLLGCACQGQIDLLQMVWAQTMSGELGVHLTSGKPDLLCKPNI